MPKALRPYQQKSLEILSHNNSGLDASEMGTGKTLVGTELVRLLETGGRIPRTLAIGPVNTHPQWIASFAEQFPALAGTDYLRIIGTPRSDPDSWQMMTSKLPGVYVTSWEAMRGLIPYSVKIINEKDPRQKKDATGAIPPGWKKARAGGASRGYGDLYGQGRKLTVKAVRMAMKCGDVPPWDKTGTWDLVIADESHRMQNRNSSNRRVINLINTTRKLALSGTPAGNKPEGIWSTLNWLWKEQYRSFWDWAHENMIVEERHISQYETVKEITGEKYPGAIFADIPCVVRWRTEEVADQLPSVMERVVPVTMGPRQKKIYNDFETQSFTWLDGQPVMVDLPIEQRIRLRQAALGQLRATPNLKRREKHMAVRAATRRWDNQYIPIWSGGCAVGFMNSKGPAIHDADEIGNIFMHRLISKPAECVVGFLKYTTWIEEVEIGFAKTGEQPKIETIREIISDLPENEPVLIFTHSAKWAAMCAEALDKDCGPARAWTGALTGNQRQKLKADFGKGVRILVAQIASLAEGVDGLQFVCRCEIWASQSDDGLMNNQAKARLHRPGQTRMVQRWLLQSDETIDAGLEERLRIRRAQMKRMYRDKEK